MSGTAPILTGGYGPWGGVELLPTLGFGVGEAEVVVFRPSGLYRAEVAGSIMGERRGRGNIAADDRRGRRASQPDILIETIPQQYM